MGFNGDSEGRQMRTEALLSAVCVALLVGCGTEETTGTETTTTGPTATTQLVPEESTTTPPAVPRGIIGTAPPATDPPETDPPATDPPATDPPTTRAPAVSYRNCSEVKAAGAAPIRRGQPGYSSSLDRDGDGIACET